MKYWAVTPIDDQPGYATTAKVECEILVDHGETVVIRVTDPAWTGKLNEFIVSASRLSDL